MHNCPYPGCKRQVSDDQLSCGPHWFKLPQDIRNAVWRGWKHPEKEGHAEALQEALKFYGKQPPVKR